jgi:actin-like ATPase involved in cell morphogenesis
MDTNRLLDMYGSYTFNNQVMRNRLPKPTYDAFCHALENGEPLSKEIAADIAENGMVLSGGGGRIHNLDKLITKRTGLEVAVADNAFEAVALGAGKSLEDVEKLKVYASGGRKR